MNAIVQVLHRAMEAAGLTSPPIIHLDDKLRRFNGTGKRGAKCNSWYVGRENWASFGDWGLQFTQTCCAKSDGDMSDAERRAMREHVKAAQRMRDAETTRRHGETASTALALWEVVAPAVAHPYLTAKGVRPYGIRTDGHRMFVPMRDTAGKLHSLQTIVPDGSKRFMPGGRVKGCYHAMGRPSGRVIVCEGYATGATLHEATGDAVAVAFNAGNLLSVAMALRVKYPCMSIVVAADDDWKTAGNPGLTAARQAAQAVGGKVAVPDFTGYARGDKHTDYNDLHRLARAVQFGGEG